MNPEPTNPSSSTSNILTIPIAIIIAGALIAGGIITSNYVSGGSSAKTGVKPAISSSARVLPPVTSDDHIIGEVDAEIVFVEYSDTECPFCKVFHKTMHQLLAEYKSSDEGKLAWVYRHLPLYKPDANGQSLHSKAGKEAEALECAAELGGNDGFWKYTDLLYETTPSNNRLDLAQLPVLATKIGMDTKSFNSCLSSGKYKNKVDTQYQEAFTAGAQGTPFVALVTKEKMSSRTQNKILQNVLAAFAKSMPQAVVPPETILFEPDGYRISFSGALPIEVIRAIVDSI